MLALWMFIAVFVDIFRRRDLPGIAKALWAIVVFILPIVGSLIYIIVRPPLATFAQDLELLTAQRRVDVTYATDEIARAKQLLDSGAITPEEFEILKRQAITM